ncbi:MAG: MarP family serine protease [Actinobacteria bacterium]|nr:MarP family serine protease [Actinomycetota bacterium]
MPFHLTAAIGFDILDVILLIAVAISAIRGIQLGASVQLGSYAGFWIGLFLGAIVAPVIVGPIHTPLWRTIVSLVILFGTATLLAGAGRRIGVKAWRTIRKVKLAAVDSALGAAIAVVATLLGVWILAGIAVNSPFTWLSSQVASSRIVRALDNVLPAAPSVFSRVQAFVNSQGFPSVFASLPPQLAGPVGLPDTAQVNQVVKTAEVSTLKIEGVGCGQIQEGSGFVVAPNIVVTNAHVVAGIANPYIIDSRGQHHATVIYFNPRLDLALLKTQGLTEPPLTVSTQTVYRDTEAVVLGYPGGGPLTYGPAGVMATFNATGRDIYGQGLTTRLVYEIEAIVRPGNSGGPLLNMKGQVIGVVFSRSTTNPNIGFALASPAVDQKILANEHSTKGVSSGGCVS